MVQFNLNQREITLKLVYYGPALSGKTTNLQSIHRMVPQGGAGRLMTLETRDDRTLFFDLLPVVFRTQSGFRVKTKLFTVPGQVMHDSTRRIVLQGADGVAFIADSQLAESEANKVAFRNLNENLTANGIDPDTIPTVIQFNKRDLPHIRSEAELQAFEQRRTNPVYRAVAIRGVGVLETLRGLMQVTWDHLDENYQISEKLQVDRSTFLDKMFEQWRPGTGAIG